MENKNQIKWINSAKFMAIMAVMINHTYGILYENQNVLYAFYYSVSLFILISGMMSYNSIEKHSLGWFQNFIRSSKKIVVAYLVATFIYHVYNNYYFDFNTYFQNVINFNITGPFYYVLLYLQLMMVSKLVYNVVNKIPNKFKYIWEIGIAVVILFICSLTTNYTNILNVYGGGGKLLGGTYLFLFYLGMILAKHDIFSKITFKKSVIIGIISMMMWFFCWKFVCVDQFAIDTKLHFGIGLNPPSITLSVMAIIILFMSFGIYNAFQYVKCLKWITDVTSWIGKYTLYIFLYHKFFIDYVNWKILSTNYIWLNRILYFGFMIFGSIGFYYIFMFLKKIFSDDKFVILKRN